MSMVSRRMVLVLFRAICLGSVALAASAARPPPPDYALLTAGAAHSLLLDIARAGDRLVAVGERGHILTSADGGASWVQAQVPTSVMLTRAFFVDDALGWAVGHDGNVLFSGDGGAHWALQRDGVTEQARINEERLARARGELQSARDAAVAGEDDTERAERIAVAEDAVASADAAMREPVFPPPLMSVWFATPEQGWAAGAFGTLLRTANAGRHWEDWGWKVDNPDELHFNGVAGDATGALYLASEWGDVFRSTNCGESWEVRETGYEGSFFGVLVNPATGSIFAYGLRGTIYRSRDRGENWEALDSPVRASLLGAASGPGGELLFVGQDGAVIATDDDGDELRVLPQPDRRELTGVTALADGRWFASGNGGSIPLAATGATPR